jgi:EAL domain-containing protein (putative c-di-GMP-specific phosphodiesterase class I)
MLELEITEDVAMFNEDLIIARISDLRVRGYKVSIDDFGTGYSSLGYLNKFHVHTIKIDKSFIQNDNPIINSLISLIHNVGAEVLVEGVESKEQEDLLRVLGCDYTQGYLYAKPISAAEFEHLLLAKGPK